MEKGRNTPEYEQGLFLNVPVAAGEVIYEGTLAALDASGCAVTAKKAAGLTAAGRAEETADNTSGEAGDQIIQIRRGVFLWENDTAESGRITGAHLLKPCYLKDGYTVTAENAGTSPAGIVVSAEGDLVAVDMRQIPTISQP